MPSLLRVLAATLLIPVSTSLDSQIPLHGHQARPQAKRLAIIGAGAAGSSAAFHVRKLADAANITVNITVFDSNPYIGGRSTTVNAYNNSDYPVELGASIFVRVNQILYDAAQEFGLISEGDDDMSAQGDTPSLLGVWDGSKFRYEGGTSYWDVAKLFFKYGLSVYRAQNLMKATVAKFLKMYEEPMFPFIDLAKTVYMTGLTDAVNSTGQDFLRANGIGDKFAQDIIQASTRVNYAQNLPSIHGLETMVCLATDGAMAIQGGNWRIFDRMIDSAHAEVRLNTTVTDVAVQEGYTWKIDSKPCEPQKFHQNDSTAETFDSVILAAPYQFANLSGWAPNPSLRPLDIPYVTLHVTLFTSSRKLSPAAFNLLPTEKQVPQVVLTTLDHDDDPGKNVSAVGSAGFWSISALRFVQSPLNGEREVLYKIFSPAPVDDAFLSKILGVQHGEDLPISWIYRKVWQSYPQETPRAHFSQLRLEQNFWYTAGIESFISTMETSALMGKNVARLIVDEWIARRRIGEA